jgi:hypothetical protein
VLVVIVMVDSLVDSSFIALSPFQTPNHMTRFDRIDTLYHHGPYYTVYTVLHTSTTISMRLMALKTTATTTNSNSKTMDDEQRTNGGLETVTHQRPSPRYVFSNFFFCSNKYFKLQYPTCTGTTTTTNGHGHFDVSHRHNPQNDDDGQ